MTPKVRQRSLPDQLRYHADAILAATERYAKSEVTSHALALKLLADEIEQVDDPMARWETRVRHLRETWPGREVTP